MDAALLVEGNMMAAATFGLDGIPKEPLVTIATVTREEQDGTGGGKAGERWGILHFREPWAKPYKINKTAQKALILMFGRETDAWLGKQIGLYAHPGIYFGTEGVAVRIRGSPQLKEKKSFTIKSGKKGKATYDLIPLGKGATSSPAPATPSKPIEPQPPPLDAEQLRAASKGSEAAARLEGQRSEARAREAAAATPNSQGEKVAAPPDPTVAARAATPPAGPLVPCGPYKERPDKTRRPISELETPELLETATFGDEKLAAEPNATWAPSLKAGVAQVRAELERRYNAKMAAEDAAAASAAPREPGSDDGTEPPF